MSDRISPLGADFRTGKHGNTAIGIGVTLGEAKFDFVGELAAFASGMSAIEKLAEAGSKLKGATVFQISANRWMLAGPDALRETVSASLKPADGSLIDLSHGRTSLTISGPKAEWVLSKLYAIDFGSAAFPVGTGLSTAHHNIFTQIHRADDMTFTLFIFRSFARAFWHTLQRAAEATGYEVR